MKDVRDQPRSEDREPVGEEDREDDRKGGSMHLIHEMSTSHNLLITKQILVSLRTSLTLQSRLHIAMAKGGAQLT